MFANHMSEKALLLQSVVADNQKYLMIISRERESSSIHLERRED
jgi:hypothetical protein